ncbi:hypothetical protein F5I97DRAFT_837804 [Phlebopus sp. FC_14]|nr:hypothetical protein F5I97DRAFT_837804 [Phlebopus sp. FC_14]
MFGNLGNTNPGTSGFGAFAQSTTQPAASTSAFGAPKPATGFGAFSGGPSTFAGGGSAFGSTNAPGTSGTSIFGTGAGTTTGSAFGGGGGGVFGQNKPATSFGATSPTTGQDANVAPVSTGTSSPPFSVFSEKDPSTNNVLLQYQTITAMPAYRGTSLEELRLQDYQQNRKTAGAFGQTSFGAPATQPTGLFGTTTQQPTTSSLFGGGTTGAFGSATTNQPGTSGFGGFGQSQQNQPAGGTGTGIFGGSAFGQQQQQQQQQQQSQLGAFGQAQQQPASTTGTGIFGSGSAFAQPKPATGFGNAFGATAGSAFGAHSNTGAFGQPAGQTTGTTSIFGQPQQQQPNQGTSAFATAKPSIFGQPSQPAGTTGTGFGLFGNQQQPQQGQQPQPAPSLFGGTTTTGGSLFGQPQQSQPQQPQPQTGGLFGTTAQPSGGLFGTTTGGNLFGGTQQTQTQQPAQTTSLFGAPKPATTTGTSLFGGGFGQPSTTTTGTGQQTSIFGQPLGQPAATQPSTGTSTFGSSLFGQQKPAAPALTTSSSTGGLGTSLFGNAPTLNASVSIPGAQGTLTASIAEPIAPNLPIFSMLPPGPRAVTLEQQKKKPGFFVDMPTRTPVPHLQLGYTPANSKLRGFGSTTSVLGGQPSSTLAMSLTNGQAGSLSLSRIDGKSQAGPEAFLGRSASPALGSGARQSVKKLILDKKVEPSDLFSKSASPGMRGSPGRVMFNPALSQAAREKEVAREKEASSSTPTVSRPAAQSTAPPVNATHQVPNLFTAESTGKPPQPSSPSKDAATAAPPPLQRGDYWVKPDLAKLKACGYEDLLAFKDLIVGCVGYGEIHFLEPVDLTGLPKLGALLGELVRFDDKECSVYPDGDETDKPAPGFGLNVRARIVLFHCWAVDKATREPIKDEKDPAAVKHLKRLKAMKDTHFESFDIGEGKWTFTVDHF